MKIIRINAMWCAGCLSMHKVWKEVEKKHPDIEMINYDYDMDEEIVQKYNPGSILPVTIFIENNVEIHRLNGEKTVQEITNVIESVRGY